MPAEAIWGFALPLAGLGWVWMSAGARPGETRVASVALYEHVEAGDYVSAHRLAAVLLGLSLLLLWGLFRWQRRRPNLGAMP